MFILTLRPYCFTTVVSSLGWYSTKVEFEIRSESSKYFLYLHLEH